MQYMFKLKNFSLEYKYISYIDLKKLIQHVIRTKVKYLNNKHCKPPVNKISVPF